MSNTPFMQFYPGDYLGKTMDLTTEQHGAYLLILMTMWQHDAKLPNDPKKLARIARLTPAKFAAVWSEISRFFEVDGDTITNPRMTKERKKAAEKSQKRATAGSAGGKAKALKDQESRLANAMQLPCHSPDTRNQSEEREEAKASLSAEPTFPDLAHVDEISQAVSAYNEAAEVVGWSKVQKLSRERRVKLAARLREAGGIEGWRVAMSKARASPLCTGNNERGWVASFDFLISKEKFTRLMEGQYDDRRSSRTDYRAPSHSHPTDRAIAFASRAVRTPSKDCF
ncbi:MAG: DUF1376 domain-containing protein [Alphaproteobacteria bacterium]|nr:DUF1376 domain-containing protein [Alphaproteobacteria bacterium]